jgi:hypothetical protein
MSAQRICREASTSLRFLTVNERYNLLSPLTDRDHRIRPAGVSL